MNLLLLRHAQAEKPDPILYPDDGERPLTSTGMKRHRRVAIALHRIGIRPDQIIASPRLRTRQTAEITAAVLGCEKALVQSDALGAGYSAHAALDLLMTCHPQAVIMLVGHAPDLSELTGWFLGPDAGPAVKFRKGALLGLSFPGAPQPGQGTLDFFYRPDDLLALA